MAEVVQGLPGDSVFSNTLSESIWSRRGTVLDRLFKFPRCDVETVWISVRRVLAVDSETSWLSAPITLCEFSMNPRQT